MDYNYRDLEARQGKMYNIIAGKYGATQFETYNKSSPKNYGTQENMIEKSLYTGIAGLEGKQAEGYYENQGNPYEHMIFPQSKDPTLKGNKTDKFGVPDAYAEVMGVRPGIYSDLQMQKRMRTIVDLLILTLGAVAALLIIKKLGQ
jgi:hypothetical protein